jgi:hypothetical protein
MSVIIGLRVSRHANKDKTALTMQTIMHANTKVKPRPSHPEISGSAYKFFQSVRLPASESHKLAKMTRVVADRGDRTGASMNMMRIGMQTK